MEEQLLKWAGVIVTMVSGFLGVGIGWGRAKERLDMERAERIKLEGSLNEVRGQIRDIREGGESGGALYMPARECIRFRDRCQAERCREISKIQEMFSEYAMDVRAVKNALMWSFTSEKGMSLPDVLAIFETGERRKK